MQGRQFKIRIFSSILVGLLAGILLRFAAHSIGKDATLEVSGTRAGKKSEATSTSSEKNPTGDKSNSEESPGEPSIRIGEVMASRGLERYAALALFLGKATPSDLQTLLEAWAADGSLGMNQYDSIFMRWTEIDPEGAVAYTRRKRMWERVSNWAWAKSDPEGAFAAALDGRIATGGVLRSIGQVDAKRALELLEEHPELGVDSSVQGGIVSGLSRVDLAEAIARVSMLGIGFNDVNFGQSLQTDPQGTAQIVKSIEDPHAQAEALDKVMPRLIETNPEVAKDLARSLPRGQLQANAVLDVAIALAREDSDAALSWIDTFESSGVRKLAMAGLIPEVAKRDPDTALTWLRERDIFFNTEVVSSYEKGSTFSFDAWGTSDKDYSDRRVFESLAHARPQATMEFLFNRENEKMSAFLESSESPKRDPFSNDGSPAYSVSHYNLGRSMQIWAQNDPESASAWLGAQDDVPARNAVAGDLVSGMMSNANPNFESALAWASATPNQENYKTIYSRWYHHDPESALQSLEAQASRLTETEYNNILRTVAQQAGVALNP